MEGELQQRYGQPGPLAYKLDTLIINRRIEEAGRPSPANHQARKPSETSAEELGMQTAARRLKIRRRLHQNASAYITARSDTV